MNELLENIVSPSAVKQPLSRGMIELRHPCISLGRPWTVLSTE